jgi:hypothetical protein
MGGAMVVSALSTFAVECSIGTEMKPLGGVCSYELFERVRNPLRRPIESDVVVGSRKANRSVGRNLVSTVTQAGSENRKDGGTREHSQTQRTLRHVCRLAQEGHSTPANTARHPVDLHGHGTSLPQVLHQPERRERLRADVGHLNSFSLPGRVLNGLRFGVSLRMRRYEQP